MPLTRPDAFVDGDGGYATAWQEVAPFDTLVASWAIDGLGDCEVVVRCRADGRETGRYVLGRRVEGAWESVPGQADADARVDVDVVIASRPLEAFRLTVEGAGITGARLAAVIDLAAERPASGSLPRGHAVELPVEPLSQLAYAGQDVELDGGGEAWCAPTALTMVLRHHGVEADVPDVARAVYDPPYGGCGNWSLNVAYAAARGFDAVVTRLGGVADAAELLHAGVPVIASIAAGPGELPGFPIERGTSGHLVVIGGVTDDGDPVVLDPAGRDGEVRRVYPREPFEAAWLGGAGGIAYVVHPPELELPPGHGRW